MFLIHSLRIIVTSIYRSSVLAINAVFLSVPASCPPQIASLLRFYSKRELLKSVVVARLIYWPSSGSALPLSLSCLYRFLAFSPTIGLSIRVLPVVTSSDPFVPVTQQILAQIPTQSHIPCMNTCIPSLPLHLFN